MKYADINGIQIKGDRIIMRCRNFNKKEVAKDWFPDSTKTESQNAAQLQRDYLNWKDEQQGNLQQGDFTFGEVHAMWRKHIANKKEPETLKRYDLDSVRVLAEFENAPIRNIKSYQIQNFIDELTTLPRSKTMPKSHRCKSSPFEKEPLGWKSANSHKTLISNVFSYAVKCEMANANPCSGGKIELPPKAETELKMYTSEEVIKILDLLETEATAPNAPWRYIFLYYFILTAFTTGERTGEICGLEWSDVADNCIKVTKQTTRSKQDKSTKNGKIRFIKDIPADFFQSMDDFRQRQIEYFGEDALKYGLWSDKSKIFLSEKGVPICITKPRQWFMEFCKRHNLRYISPHGCRHFNISRRLMSGEDLVSTAYKSGHDLKTMIERYTHYIDDNTIKESEALSVFNRHGETPALKNEGILRANIKLLKSSNPANPVQTKTYGV